MNRDTKKKKNSGLENLERERGREGREGRHLKREREGGQKKPGKERGGGRDTHQKEVINKGCE